MADTTYSNFTTPAVDAEWLNDTNRLVYQLAGNAGAPPLNDSDVRDNLGVTAAIAAGDAATLASATALPGRLIGVQTFTANGTYTPTAGTNSIVVELQGGGGASGGSQATGAGQISIGSGGGGGGYVKSRITSGFSGQAVTIGAGGVGVLGASGGAGGNSTFMGLTAGGGGGGPTAPAGGTSVASGANGGSASGGNILNIAGQNSDEVIANFSASVGSSGTGGDSYFGRGGRSLIAFSSVSNGNAGVGYGAGAGGARAQASQPAGTGGNGTPGICIIYEYN